MPVADALEAIWRGAARVIRVSESEIKAAMRAYFADTLAAWEQGRFIRFNGLAQWLGWLWPFATLVYVLVRVSRKEAPPTIPE